MLEPITPVPIQPRRCVAGETKGILAAESVMGSSPNGMKTVTVSLRLIALPVNRPGQVPAVYAIFPFFAIIF